MREVVKGGERVLIYDQLTRMNFNASTMGRCAVMICRYRALSYIAANYIAGRLKSLYI